MLGIPRFLLGEERKVSRACKKAAAKLIKTANWPEFLSGMEFVPLERVARFALQGPRTLCAGDPEEEDGDDDTAVLHPFCDRLSDIAATDNYALLPQAKRLLIEGCQEFWVALTALAGQGPVLPIYRDAALDADFARQLLARLLPWWPQFSALNDKFFHAGWFPGDWPRWASRIFQLCGRLGMTGELTLQIRQGSSEQAFVTISEFAARESQDR